MLRPLVTRGQVHYERDELDEAIADFTAALELDAKNVEALRGRGRAYYEQDELEKALADLNEAIRLAPIDAEAFVAQRAGPSPAR